MTLHIVTWLWKGWRPVYDRRDVAYLASQLVAHGGLPAGTRILCLTDLASDWYKQRSKYQELVTELPLWPELPGLNMGVVPAYPWLPAFKGQPNCYRRLKIFDPATQASLGINPGDIILSMDLDSVVMGSIGKLLEPFSDYAGIGGTVPQGPNFMAMEGRVSRIHGSLFALRAGNFADVWRKFDPVNSPRTLRFPGPEAPQYIGSDQAWMSTVMPEVPLWGEEDHVYSWPRHHSTLTPNTPLTYMSFAGHAKPRGSLCRELTPWLYAHAMRHWEE